jgi:hypothetical protein
MYTTLSGRTLTTLPELRTGDLGGGQDLGLGIDRFPTN